MAIESILLVIKRTNPIQTIAPTNAAAIRVMLLALRDLDKRNTIASATHIFAPDEMPSTKGPAMGLWKNVCKRYPERASAPPRINTDTVLGSLILQRIVLIVVSVSLPESELMISGIEIFTLPMQTLSTKKTPMPTKSIAKAIMYLSVFLVFIMLLSLSIPICKDSEVHHIRR